jgi:hypothetical protein
MPDASIFGCPDPTQLPLGLDIAQAYLRDSGTAAPLNDERG